MTEHQTNKQTNKQNWAPNNWCFWTVILEKTLESPLDSKEIQPVHPKGNQSWIFIGRTDTKALILWPSDANSWLIWKDSEVMSLLFNMQSNFVIAFLPQSKHLLISWLQSPSAVILEPKKIKSATVSVVSPSICHEVMGPDAMILVYWMLSFKTAFSLLSLSSRGSWAPFHFLP